MKLYSAWYCPFAQRAWMTLVHKQINFEYIEVDPYRESEWWLNISRGEGLVPVLVQTNADDEGETTIIESNRILEYLDHVQPDLKPIFPEDPNQRAEQKYWMDAIGQRVTPFFYQYLKTAEQHPAKVELKTKLTDGMKTITSAMSADGLYFHGEEIGAVDLSLFPIAYRIDRLLSHYRDFRLPDQGATWHRYRRWFDAMLQHPAFVKTAFAQGDDYESRLIEHYESYTQENESTH